MQIRLQGSTRSSSRFFQILIWVFQIQHRVSPDPGHLVGSSEDADGGVGGTASVVDQAGVLGDADLPVSVVSGFAGAFDVVGLLGALGVGVAVSLGAGS